VRFGDAAVLVDDVGDPFRVLIARRAGGAISEADFAIGVAQQREREVELFGKAGVGGYVVETRAEDRRVLRFVLVDEVPEPGTLGRSARCVGLRIKPEHDLAAAQIVKGDLAPVVIRHFKIRSFVANVQHSSSAHRAHHETQHSAKRHGSAL
jgi:hypothetical protein